MPVGEVKYRFCIKNITLWYKCQDKIYADFNISIVERCVPLGLNSKRALLRYCSIVPATNIETPLFVKDTLIPINQSAVKQLFMRQKVQTDLHKLQHHFLCYTGPRVRRGHLQLAVNFRSYIARNGEKVCALDSLKNGSQLCGSFATR